ncbi:MAG: PmoA family protein [Rhodospirillales bacterium]
MSRLPLVFLFLGLPLAAQVKFTHSSDRISVAIDGKPFTEFIVSADVNKPYLHPLRSASGKIVTRFFPMDLVEGERRDHPHHRGLWFTHGDVNGYDFWANEPGQKGAKKGRVLLKKIVDLKDGKKSGTIVALFDWLDTNNNPLVTESRAMTFYSEPSLRTIDIDITLTAVPKVVFGDTKEGTFAIRLAPSLEEDPKGAPATPKRTGTMRNAEGAKTENQVWGKRSPWVDYYGEVEGEKLGIAILDHPGNPRHPTYWHARGYGLFAANPFGVSDFENDKTKDGSLTLDAGQSVRFRYRVIIHPGDFQTSNIAAQFERYAKTK